MECSGHSIINSTCAAQSVGPANQLFIGLIQTLFTVQCSISPPSMWPKDYASEALERGVEEYDFVVVGAGSAGATVAGRLAEVKEWKVLLLEAGEDPPIESELPGMDSSMLNTLVDWQMYAEPSENACKSASTGRCYYPRGKMLGGTSAISSMMYVRGNPHIYDKWAEEGNTGWDYNSVLPYFKKSEGNTNETLVEGANKLYHNAYGPVKVSYARTLTDGDKIIINAANELGISFVDDINGKHYSGITLTQSTAYQGRRESTAKAYLSRKSKNLHVIKNAMVDKFILNDRNEVESVEFIINKKHKLSARIKKEAILSAGTMMSSAVLMRSGIGPRKQLRKFGIENKVDLRVGENFIDHANNVIWYKHRPYGIPTQSKMDSVYDLATNNSGSLTRTGYLATWFNVNNKRGDPNIQSHYVSIPKDSPSSIERYMSLFNTPVDMLSQLNEINKEFDLLGAQTFLLTPRSRGRIELSGKSPYQYPKIYANIYDDPDDRRTMLKAIKRQIMFAQTKSYQSIDAEVVRINFDECNGLEDNDYWMCYIKQATMPGHSVGTSRMGPCSDPRSVVDPELKVCGVKKLRQIDAGIMPEIPSANPNAAVMMIGEKGADMIKRTHLRI